MTAIAASSLGPERTARRTSPGASWVLLSLPMLMTLALVFAVPIGCLIGLSFYSMTGPATVGDQLTAENYLNFFTDFFYFRILLNTFWLGAVVVISCLVIGYPVSYFLARTQSRWRGFLLFLVVAPLLVSAVVRNIGWFPILSNSGLVNWLLLKFGLVSQPVPLISNFTGVVIGLVHALLPFMILTLTTVIQRIEPELEEASASLGAGPVTNLFRGDAAAEPAWHDRGLAAGLHHGDRRLHHAGDHGRQPRAGDGDFHRPAIPHRPRLCARRDRGGGPDAAGRPAHATGGAVRRAADGRGAMTKVILPAVLTATFVFLLAPIIVVVLASFNGVGVLSFPPQAFTTRWYYEIDPSFYRALWVSLLVGVITVVLAVLVGVPGALGLARGRFRGRDAINAFCLSPLMVPALVTGVALFQFSLVFWDLFRVTVGGTIAGLVIGHLTFAIPFVIRSVLASHTRFDHALEEAAANLGATPLQTFFRVTLPILKPGIASGAIFAFLISLDEVPIALFMGGGDATTLPVKIFTAIEISFGGDILAVASLVVCGSVVLMLVLDRLVGLERLFATKN